MAAAAYKVQAYARLVSMCRKAIQLLVWATMPIQWPNSRLSMGQNLKDSLTCTQALKHGDYNRNELTMLL